MAASNKTRTKVAAPALVIRDRAELDIVVGDIARLKTEESALTSHMNERITAIRAEFEGRLTEITGDLAVKTGAVANWASANTQEFDGKKTLRTIHGDIGWRTGTPALKTLKGWTWDRVLEKLAISGLDRFIRTKAEVDKQAILIERDQIELAPLGVQVVQDETFFVDPALTTTDNRLTAVAA